MNRTFQVSSSFFTAGIEVSESKIVIDAPPIIKYMKGWKLGDVRKYCSKRNFKLKEVV